MFQMAYMIFLVLFTYTVLVKMAPTPTWQGNRLSFKFRSRSNDTFTNNFRELFFFLEVYSIAYITTMGCEKIREIISSEPVAISYVKSPSSCKNFVLSLRSYPLDINSPYGHGICGTRAMLRQ